MIKTKSSWYSTAVFGLLGFAAFTTPAQAQTPSPLPEWEYSAGVLLRSSVSPTIPTWETVLGISAEYLPRYDGARDSHVLAGPLIDIRYRDLAFLSTGEGLGINIFRGKKYRAGAALSYDLGRKEGDSPDLRGLGDVNIAPELKLFGEYLFFPAMLRADVRRGLGGHGGWIGDISAYSPVCCSKKFVVFLGPSVTFADATYMGHYFGVTPNQAAASGLPAYSANAGLKSASLGMSAVWLYTDHWLINALAGGDRLLGDAAGSPITHEKTQYAVSLTLAYLL